MNIAEEGGISTRAEALAWIEAQLQKIAGTVYCGGNVVVSRLAPMLGVFLRWAKAEIEAHEEAVYQWHASKIHACKKCGAGIEAASWPCSGLKRVLAAVTEAANGK